MDRPDERLVQLLATPQVRAVLAELEGDPRRTVSELAEALVSRDVHDFEAADRATAVQRLKTSLHHEYLPRLDEAGLLTYDSAENVASRSPSTEVDNWGGIEELTELLSAHRPGSGDDGIGILTGSDAVYDYGRQLADEADEELFLIYTSDELLDEACLPYAKRAIERGVDFHAGTRTESTRQFFNETLPEATVWEPQVDWMKPRGQYPRISRLIFADREKVVVGLWDETAGDNRREIAMVGEGASNPLVVLVRELLGPRLDHLDYQSEDFLGRLPFES
ncbi:ArsR family transcriptional regulator [Halobacteriales archaeon Cl-PHB]